METSVEYLLVCSKDFDLIGNCVSSLELAYTDSDENDPDMSLLLNAIRINYKLERNDDFIIIGFTVSFEIDPEQAVAIVENFGKELISSDTENFVHLVKFRDDSLKLTNEKYSKEIFDIEMKLRECLSIIFVDTFRSNYYSFLSGINIKLTSDDESTDEHMNNHYENQLFYILFSDYVNCNERSNTNSIQQLKNLIRESSDFDELKNFIISQPIVEERYTEFIGGIRSSLIPIEKVRNCVAHNRTISRKKRQDYALAKEKLLEVIQEFYRNNV